MADTQYLRLSIDDCQFLLPSAASVAIEQRDALSLDGAAAPVAAWHQAHLQRWPALFMDAALKPTRRDRWQRAVFLDGAVGFVVDDVQLITRPDLPVMPFAPLGAPPLRAGHFFNGAWVNGHEVTLVIDPVAFSVYLQGLVAA